MVHFRLCAYVFVVCMFDRDVTVYDVVLFVSDCVSVLCVLHSCSSICMCHSGSVHTHTVHTYITYIYITFAVCNAFRVLGRGVSVYLSVCERVYVSECEVGSYV